MSRKLQIFSLIPQAFLVWWGTGALLALPLQLKEIYATNYLGDKPLPGITNFLMKYADLVENLKHSYDDLAIVFTLTFLFIGIFIVLSSAPDKVVASRSFLFQTLTLLFLGFALLLFYAASIMPFITMLNEMSSLVSSTMPEKLWDAAPWVIGIVFLTILIFRYRKWRKNHHGK